MKPSLFIQLVLLATGAAFALAAAITEDDSVGWLVLAFLLASGTAGICGIADAIYYGTWGQNENT
jgi:hypothetical protein